MLWGSRLRDLSRFEGASEMDFQMTLDQLPEMHPVLRKVLTFTQSKFWKMMDLLPTLK